jgi:hypothetical protein
MSTYLYLVCVDHDPPLFSEEVTQHTHKDGELEKIRGWVGNRDEWVRLRHEQDDLTYADYFLTHAITFLTAHPKCHLIAQDEYGEKYAVMP